MFEKLRYYTMEPSKCIGLSLYPLEASCVLFMQRSQVQAYIGISLVNYIVIYNISMVVMWLSYAKESVHVL